MTAIDETIASLFTANASGDELYVRLMEKVSEYGRACEDRVRYLEQGRYPDSTQASEKQHALYTEICAALSRMTIGK